MQLGAPWDFESSLCFRVMLRPLLAYFDDTALCRHGHGYGGGYGHGYNWGRKLRELLKPNVEA